MSSGEIAARVAEFRATAAEIEGLADEAIRSRNVDDLITVVRGLLDALDVVLLMASRIAASDAAAAGAGGTAGPPSPEAGRAADAASDARTAAPPPPSGGRSDDAP
jgi:hypothetical protein